MISEIEEKFDEMKELRDDYLEDIREKRDEIIKVWKEKEKPKLLDDKRVKGIKIFKHWYKENTYPTIEIHILVTDECRKKYYICREENYISTLHNYFRREYKFPKSIMEIVIEWR